jgi:hypothetical protein
VVFGEILLAWKISRVVFFSPMDKKISKQVKKKQRLVTERLLEKIRKLALICMQLECRKL